MPRPVSCFECGSRGEHEPDCQVGREVANIERRSHRKVMDSKRVHPAKGTRRSLSVVEAMHHPPDCDCSWWCRYFSEHGDDEGGLIA